MPQHQRNRSLVLIMAALLLLSACNITRHVPENKYLLRKNKVDVKTNGFMLNKGEMRDALFRLIVQKPNTYSLQGLFPYRLWTYNLRYNKLKDRPDSLLPKSKERPVLYDSSYVQKTIKNMKSYLFNMGYFYATVKDTVVYKGKKAYKTYTVNTRSNYLINNIRYDIDDSAIAAIVMGATEQTILKKNKAFTYSLTEAERSRLNNLIRDNGYYYFSLDNIRFVLDTLDKTFLRDIDNPLENALNFISASKKARKPTLDIEMIIRTGGDQSNIPFRIKKVNIFADYAGASDFTDTTMDVVDMEGVKLSYHDRYVNPGILAVRNFIKPGALFSQSNYDNTVVKLNELGIFQFIRVQYSNNRDSTLSCNIFLNKTKKLDVNTNYEVSSGTTYQLGNSAGVSFRNKNFEKGANLLMVSLTGGIELTYNENQGKDITDHFSLITGYYGLNSSLDFPKFLLPVNAKRFSKVSLPRTIFTAGTNVINRVQYFTLVNTNAGFRYNWRETTSKTWDIAPAFVNVIRLPRKTEAFQQRLEKSGFLANSYKPTYIEGENVSYTFNNSNTTNGKGFTRYKMSAEEAGSLLAGVESISNSVKDQFTIAFAQYMKFDVDFQRFYNLRHSMVAMRFYGGVGVPYGASRTLPYIKQYYVGGPFSLRGWRIRSLGPGSYFDSTNLTNLNTLDRTGDIKLEGNLEYRFPVAPLFAGLVKMNGAVFADAGNIWLARKDDSITGGEFAFYKLGKDLAMDFGIGSRFEIASFLTVRVDAAVPVKKPYLPKKNGWVIDKLDFYDPNWRSNNIVLNISIGYPF